MEEDDDSLSMSSVDAFMNAHYFEIEDMDILIDRNKVICTRWQEEYEQLKEDEVLRDILYSGL